MTATATCDDRAERSALGTLSTIRAAYLALQWIELSPPLQDPDDLSDDARDLLAGIGWQEVADDPDSVVEAIRYQMLEMPLDITQHAERSCCWEKRDWQVTEIEFLLSTGGPAVRILARDYDGETASNAVLQYQDWFTPWRDVPTSSDGDEILDWFVGLFCICED